MDQNAEDHFALSHNDGSDDDNGNGDDEEMIDVAIIPSSGDRTILYILTNQGVYQIKAFEFITEILEEAEKNTNTQ